MMRDNDVENSEEDVGKPRTERDEDDSVSNEKFLFKEVIINCLFVLILFFFTMLVILVKCNLANKFRKLQRCEPMFETIILCQGAKPLDHHFLGPSNFKISGKQRICPMRMRRFRSLFLSHYLAINLCIF